MKGFRVVTTTKNGKYVFLTNARCGKGAVRNLLTHSGDFKHILGMVESDRMTIKVNPLKAEGKHKRN